MPRQVEPGPLSRGKRAARAGILTNALLAALKLVAGVLGNSYALVADAIESSADVVSSTIVLGGLQVAGREPDDQYPFGYGRAETLAGEQTRTPSSGRMCPEDGSSEAARRPTMQRSRRRAWRMGITHSRSV